MTLNLQLPPETEAKVRERAAAARQDVESFVLQALAEKLADADLQPTAAARNGQEWADQLRACIDLHPVTTRFVDDSRDSIYAGRGE